MRYFIHLSYNGSAYRGWQNQIGIVSIQQVLEDRLSKLFKREITVHGCGRTDAQVHASQFFAHVDLHETWEYDICFLLNKALPNDIVVHDVIPMHDDANAQLDASERTYDYFFHTERDTFISPFSSYYDDPHLNLEAMQKATALLSQYDDYRALCKTPDRHNHTRCRVTSAFIKKGNRGTYHFQIVANRFLKGMIRVIVWHLLEIGRGTISVDEFEELFITKERSDNFSVAFPQGLYLSKITYPFLNEPVRTGFCRGLI